MLGDSTILPATYCQPATIMPKYPPPLIPMRQLNGQMQYDLQQNHYRSNDIVDLSGQNRTLPPQIHPQPVQEEAPQVQALQMQAPQMQAPQMQAPQMQAPQALSPHLQALQEKAPQLKVQLVQAVLVEAAQGQAPQVESHQLQAPQAPALQPPQAQQVQAREDAQTVLNGRLQTLIPISDIPLSGGRTPYKMQRAFIDNMMIPCINMKPYVYTDLLVTIPDLISKLFHNVSIRSCLQVMQVLGVELYKANKAQVRVMFENGKCRNLNDCVPLVQVRFVLEFMPQLKYMLGRFTDCESMPKQPRTK